MSKANIYLNFNWNTQEAFNFYKSIFGWDFSEIHKFWDIPNLPWSENMSDIEKKGIMHISFPIFDNLILMWTDVLDSFWLKLVEWNNVQISLNVWSKEEAEKLFKWLSDWWKIEMPLDDMFWWAYFWSFCDKFWINWMINYDYPKN